MASSERATRSAGTTSGSTPRAPLRSATASTASFWRAPATSSWTTSSAATASGGYTASTLRPSASNSTIQGNPSASTRPARSASPTRTTPSILESSDNLVGGTAAGAGQRHRVQRGWRHRRGRRRDGQRDPRQLHLREHLPGHRPRRRRGHCEQRRQGRRPGELRMDYPVFTAAALGGHDADRGRLRRQRAEPGDVRQRPRRGLRSRTTTPAAYGEGKTYLGFLTADANGNFAGTLDVTGKGLLVGEKITGTATDAEQQHLRVRSERRRGRRVRSFGPRLRGRQLRRRRGTQLGDGVRRRRLGALGRPRRAVRRRGRVRVVDHDGWCRGLRLPGVAAGNYTVRVVSSSVTSSRTGYVAT